jgi:hypothetical protein
VPRAPRTVPLWRLVGVLAGVALAAAGCSDPAPPGDVPPPAATSAPAPAPSASTSSSATTAAPSASPTAAAPSSSTAPAPPQPSSDGTVESRPVETAAPKKLDEPTKTAGATVSLVSVRATTVKATGPADSSGPGVLVRLKMTNTTGKTLDTSFVQVNVSNAAGDPGTLVIGRPTDAITGSLRAGRSAEGTYAFVLDDAGSGTLTVAVYVTSGQPVVTFRGRAS